MTASWPTPAMCSSYFLSSLLISSSSCSLCFPPLTLLLFPLLSPFRHSLLVPSLLSMPHSSSSSSPTSFYLCIFASSHPPSSTLLWPSTNPFNQLPVQSTGVEGLGEGWWWGGFCLKPSARLLDSRREKQYLPCLCSLLPTQPCYYSVVTRAERRQKLSWLKLSRSLDSNTMTTLACCLQSPNQAAVPNAVEEENLFRFLVMWCQKTLFWEYMY